MHAPLFPHLRPLASLPLLTMLLLLPLLLLTVFVALGFCSEAGGGRSPAGPWRSRRHTLTGAAELQKVSVRVASFSSPRSPFHLV